MLTIGKDRTFLHSDDFDEIQSLRRDYLMTIETDDTFRWYKLGEAIKDKSGGWIIPLQLVSKEGEAEARKTGSIRDFRVRDDRLMG